MSDNLFKSMDDDGSGMVDYRELIKGCAKLVHDATMWCGRALGCGRLLVDSGKIW